MLNKKAKKKIYITLVKPLNDLLFYLFYSLVFFFLSCCALEEWKSNSFSDYSIQSKHPPVQNYYLVTNPQVISSNLNFNFKKTFIYPT